MADTVELELHIHHETDGAILVSDDGDKDGAVWLPKSQVTFDGAVGEDTIVTCPEWIAVERGLV